jgi:hypothetical protein
MPDVPIKPPNKRVDELVTDLTLSVSEMFEDEKILTRRYSKMITYLVRELAKVKIELDEK